MPNPVVMMKLDQEQRGAVPFRTSTRGIPPPLVTTNFTVFDDGNASPRFMRSTLYNVPCSRDLLTSCRIPLGLVVQPLATIPDRENTLHLVDHGAGGPLRCNRCKTYINPFVRFVDGGRKYLCPICQCSNDVLQEYFCHLDHSGVRIDAASRPELTYGSVEYVATADYCKDGRLPKPPAYIFLIDVSAASVNSGLLPLLSQNILTVLERLPDAGEEGGSPILVGLATYDTVLHFYNLNSNLAQPGMMVVADTADVFVPMVDGFLVNAKEARGVMESLLSQLPQMFSGVRPSEVILEPAVRAGLEALKAAQRNGRLFVFHTGLPSAQAPGQLKNRLDAKLLGTDKEKTLLQPTSSPYQKLAEECVKQGVAVELFLTPPTYCDVATLGGLCSTTGGQLHLFHGYKTSADGSRLVSELTHCVARHTGFDAVMRLRACTGLRPTGFYGAFHMQNTTDIELGNIDTDKAIAVEIKHDDKLKEEDSAFFQAALLYTTYKGERRLRIHNLSLNCTTKFQDIYRSSEIDTVINFFSKSLIHASLSMPYKTIKDNFTNQCAVMLACYRKQCSSQSPAGQLILPESLKLLPMYANCMLKSDALLSPPILSIDEKCWLMYSVLSMSLEQSGAFFYPRMVSLHDVNVDEKGLPPILRCTGQKLQDTGVYVIGTMSQ
jgi:protein transport protein SEC24